MNRLQATALVFLLMGCGSSADLSSLKSTEKLKIGIKTGNVDNAGTDAQVSLTLHTNKGEITIVSLDNEKDNFEKNQYDYFEVYIRDFQTLYGITLAQDETGNKPGWYVDYVDINSKDFNGKFWRVPVNAWVEPTVYRTVY